MAAPTPVTVMTMTELNELNPGSTVAEQLDELPQFFATPTAQRGGNAISTTAGGSYLNLRGMGLNRTLVLLDGTRMAPADANGSVNVDNFPAALIQRVDIVTGGASAAYGADAVAGVVNFVLNREFEGIKTHYSTGITEEQDGENYNFSFAGGHAFLDDKLHLIGSVDLERSSRSAPLAIASTKTGGKTGVSCATRTGPREQRRASRSASRCRTCSARSRRRRA